jgi:hypothetical protein
MKITKTKLVEIIKEELDAVLKEEGSGEDWTEKLSDEEFKEYFEARRKLINSAKADGATEEEAEEYADEMLRPQKSETPPKPLQAYPPDAISF